MPLNTREPPSEKVNVYGRYMRKDDPLLGNTDYDLAQYVGDKFVQFAKGDNESKFSPSDHAERDDSEETEQCTFLEIIYMLVKMLYAKK